jgi:hypothetical protein
MGCQFYDRKNGAGEARSLQWGQCRRTSPMLSPMTAKSYMIDGVWPTVRDDDWCGEWKSQMAARRIGESLGAPLAPKGPAVPSVPRVAPLTSVSAMSAIGAGTVGQGGAALLGAVVAAPRSAGD